MSDAATTNGEVRPEVADAFTCLSEVEPEPVEWLWPGVIPRGKLASIAGDPEVGKSYLTAEIASRVARGERFPFSDQAGDPEHVLVLSAEDDVRDTIKPRVDAAGGDHGRVKALEGVPHEGRLEPWKASDKRHRAFLAMALKDYDPGLVVVDPVAAFLGSANAHKNSQVRSVLGPLAEMAALFDTAFLLVRHLRKAVARSVIHMGNGSIGFAGAVRSEVLVGRDPEEPEDRVLVPIKNNLAEKRAPLGFRITDDGIVFTGVRSGLSPEDVLEVDVQDHPERDRAILWLQEVLGEGPRPAREVQEAAERADISRRTLNRAKRDLGVRSVKAQEEDGPWRWELPEGCHG